MVKPKCLANKKTGFGLIEVLMAVAIFLVIGLSIPRFFTSSRQQMTNLMSSTDCQSTANSILSNVKSLDNSLSVRVFQPSSSRPNANSYMAGAEADPFCRPGEGRRPVCDRHSILGVEGSNYIVTGAPLYNSQNIRGAATWAQSLFNQYAPGICTNEGLSLVREELQGVLPNSVVLPAWITSVRLFIAEEGPGATACTAGAISRIGANSSNQYVVAITLRGEKMNCSAQTRVSFPQDLDASTLTLSLTNGAGQNIPNLPTGTPACSCQTSVPDILAAGGVCPGMNEVRHRLNSSEPGTVLLCRKEFPASQADPADRWRSCGDFRFQGSESSFNPDLNNQVAFNQPLDTRLFLRNLPTNSPGEHYQLRIRDVDVGGNTTDVLARYRVRLPVCPDRNSYCPSATPTGTGIFYLPTDDCGIGPCPAGTRSVCDETVRPTVCVGSTYADDCGANVCGGSRPVRCGNPDDYACGTPVPDLNGCGGSCGTGTRGCGTGTTTGGTTGGSCIADNDICGENSSECGVSGSYDRCSECCAGNGWYQHDTGYEPYNTNCPGACNMEGPKYRRYHCTPRSGIPSPRPGTPESCGTPVEPVEPRPQPWEWTGGMFQCTDTNNARSCTSTFDRGIIPTRGYSRFEVQFEIGVIAHDNDPREMSARIDLTLRSGGSTDQFIEEMQPRTTRGLEARPWRGTLTVPNNGEPIFTIRTRVDEATTRTYFSIRAIP